MKIKEIKNTEKGKAVVLSDNTIVYQPDQDIEDVLYTALAEKFTNGKSNQKTWLSSFIDKEMDSLKSNLKNPDLALKSAKELNRLVSKTQEYFNRKTATNTDFSRYLLREMLHVKQKLYYDSISKKTTLLWGRRTGKSYCIVQKAIKHCLQEPLKINGTTRVRQAIIIGLTMEKTAAIYWENIKLALDKAHIYSCHIDNSSYTITFNNGNRLFLYGNNSKAEREKLRGFDLSFVALDECQSQQALLYIIDNIIGPQLKGTNGELTLAGTAPLSAGTYWERALNDDTYEHSRANMTDNPFIPNHELALEEVLKENNWTKDNITFKREYLAEIAYDTERLVIPKKTYYTDLKGITPIGAVIAFDPGWQDYSSFATIIYDQNGNGYIIDEYKQNHVASSVLLDKAKAMIEHVHKEYNIPLEDITIVQDTSHKMILEDLFNSGFTNVVDAYKLDESTQWGRLSEACSYGMLSIKKDSEFDKETEQVVWSFDEERNAVIYTIDEKVQHPHIMDTVRYAWNYIYSTVLYQKKA